MRHLHLSEVQSTNLQLLHVILVGAQRDLVETCRTGSKRPSLSPTSAGCANWGALRPKPSWRRTAITSRCTGNRCASASIAPSTLLPILKGYG